MVLLLLAFLLRKLTCFSVLPANENKIKDSWNFRFPCVKSAHRSVIFSIKKNRTISLNPSESLIDESSPINASLETPMRSRASWQNVGEDFGVKVNKKKVLGRTVLFWWIENSLAQLYPAFGNALICIFTECQSSSCSHHYSHPKKRQTMGQAHDCSRALSVRNLGFWTRGLI